MTNHFVITTNIKENEDLINKAKELAIYFKTIYIKRDKLRITELIQKYHNILVVYKEKVVYYNESGEQLFFHPDTAIIRIKNKNDALIDMIAKVNQTILDMTMGLARDSIVMSYYGNKVTALEKNQMIHYIVSNGLKNFLTKDEKLNEAMRNIQTYHIDSYEFLKLADTNAYDVIYIDPMFTNSIKYSTNLQTISHLASKDSLTAALLEEMKRVASKKIIIKAHNLDPVFEKYGFKRNIRPGSKFSYGYIDLENKISYKKYST